MQPTNEQTMQPTNEQTMQPTNVDATQRAARCKGSPAHADKLAHSFTQHPNANTETGAARRGNKCASTKSNKSCEATLGPTQTRPKQHRSQPRNLRDRMSSRSITERMQVQPRATRPTPTLQASDGALDYTASQRWTALALASPSSGWPCTP